MKDDWWKQNVEENLWIKSDLKQIYKYAKDVFRKTLHSFEVNISMSRMICQLYLPEHLCIGHVMTLAVSDLSF